MPLICLPLGAGAGAWFAYGVGAFETPFALLGAAGGYFASGALLRRVYSESEDGPHPRESNRPDQ